jgi:hypothetical protein
LFAKAAFLFGWTSGGGAILFSWAAARGWIYAGFYDFFFFSFLFYCAYML